MSQEMDFGALAQMIARTKAEAAKHGAKAPMIKAAKGRYTGGSATRFGPISPRPGGAQSLFNKSFEGITGVKSIGYINKRGVRVTGMNVGVEMRVVADERLKKFMRRLPQASPVIKKATRQALLKAVRKEVLPTLRKEIPISARKAARRKAGKLKVGLGAAVPAGSRKRGRTEFKKKKVHIRHSVAAQWLPKGRAGSNRPTVRVTVGNSDLWYGAALHARVPYFARTLAKTEASFNREVGRALDDLVTYFATGRKGLWR